MFENNLASRKEFFCYFPLITPIYISTRKLEIDINNPDNLEWEFLEEETGFTTYNSFRIKSITLVNKNKNIYRLDLKETYPDAYSKKVISLYGRLKNNFLTFRNRHYITLQVHRDKIDGFVNPTFDRLCEISYLELDSKEEYCYIQYPSNPVFRTYLSYIDLKHNDINSRIKAAIKKDSYPFSASSILIPLGEIKGYCLEDNNLYTKQNFFFGISTFSNTVAYFLISKSQIRLNKLWTSISNFNKNKSLVYNPELVDIEELMNNSINRIIPEGGDYRFKLIYPEDLDYKNTYSLDK